MSTETTTDIARVGSGPLVGALPLRRHSFSWDAKFRMLTRRMNKAVKRMRTRAQYLERKGYSGSASELLAAAAEIEAEINKGPNDPK